MSKKSLMNSRKTGKKKRMDTPVVVYMWAIGLGILGYLIVGEGILEVGPHPIHWLAGLVGGLIGIPLGWLWHRWRGDVLKGASKVKHQGTHMPNLPYIAAFVIGVILFALFWKMLAGAASNAVVLAGVIGAAIAVTAFWIRNESHYHGKKGK